MHPQWTELLVLPLAKLYDAVYLYVAVLLVIVEAIFSEKSCSCMNIKCDRAMLQELPVMSVATAVIICTITKEVMDLQKDCIDYQQSA